MYLNSVLDAAVQLRLDDWHSKNSQPYIITWPRVELHGSNLQAHALALWADGSEVKLS